MKRHKTRRIKAEEAVKVLIDLVNTMSGDSIVAVAIARQLSKSHRTLQQSIIDQILHGIEGWLSWAKENDCFDERNQAVVDMAEDLKKVLDDHHLPFI